MKTRHDGDCTVYAALMNGQHTDGICTCGFAHQHLGHEPYDKYYELIYSEEIQDIQKERISKQCCVSCKSYTSTLELDTDNEGKLMFSCSDCGEPYHKDLPRKKRK